MKIVRPYSRPLLPTQLWLSPKGTMLREVEGAILDPPRGDRPTQRVIDLKQWAINGQPTDTVLAFRQRAIEARKISLETAMSLFFEQLYFGAANDFDNAQELYLLLPAIHDELRRRAYRRLLERTARTLYPSAPIHFLFEPEMTLEYFRLIRGDLAFRADHNEVFLIIDCGALTCNVTTVLTSRAGKVSQGQSGYSRGALNAIPGSADNRAGRYVDSTLLTEAREFVPMPDSDEASLALIEALKIETATGQQPTTIVDPSGAHSWHLTPARLRAMSDHLVAQYQPTLLDVLDRTYSQLSASALRRTSLEESGTRSGADLARTLSGVILAGGTSQLPGFREALWRTLAIPASTPHFVVGQEYPFVAAAGAMAHILDRRGCLRKPSKTEARESPVPLAASLQDDIYCVWNVEGSRENKSFRLINRDSWPGEFQTPVRIPMPSECRGKKINVSLVWGPEGHQKDEFLVTSDAPAKWFPVDCSQTVADIELSESRGGEELKLHTSGRKPKTRYYLLNTPRLVAQATLIGRAEDPEPGDSTVFAESAPVLVIDFGMSKTVVVSGEGTGTLQPADFAQLSQSVQRARQLPPGWALHSGHPRSIAAGAESPTPIPLEPPPEAATTSPASTPTPSLEHSTPSPSQFSDADPQRATATPVSSPAIAVSPATTEDEPIPSPSTEPGVRSVRTTPDEPQTLTTSPMLAQETTTAEISEPPRGQPPLRLLPHRSALSEADFIRSALEIAQAHSLDIAANDLAFLHLATSVRPLVLFTGAPGIGKTSLALFYAALLGCTPANRACVFAPVQANWISDDPLFGDDGCLTPILRQGELQPDLLQVIVFDEFNLSRPEYYLSRLLTALDYEIRIAGHALPRLSEVHGHRLFVYATLNIDEVARPPSDKILDRAFVLSPTPPEVRDDALLTRPRSFVPDYRISAEQWARWASLPAPTALPADLLALVRIFNDFERTSTATHFETVTPSRRALLDLAQIEQRFHVASLDSLGVSRNGLLDLAVSGRILPRIRGEHRRLKPLLDQLASFFDPDRWPISGRHVRSMLGRTEFGFVSFWT